ncbi:DUF4286 family protein [Parapedobacter soli]|uniref:DUF4286 family protein n=1 Tax=Parapedobacter soli TaxID=416955 RepID=UPI0021C6DDDF|nr:DUF4286 family protein [Parapedobacter soli]
MINFRHNVYLRAMYLYNVTIIVENDIHDAVRDDVRTHLLDNREQEVELSFLQLLDSPNEGITYCLQLHCQDRAAIDVFQTASLAAFQAVLHERYPGKVFFFESVMKYLND